MLYKQLMYILLPGNKSAKERCKYSRRKLQVNFKSREIFSQPTFTVLDKSSLRCILNGKIIKSQNNVCNALLILRKFIKVWIWQVQLCIIYPETDIWICKGNIAFNSLFMILMSFLSVFQLLVECWGWGEIRWNI